MSTHTYNKTKYYQILINVTFSIFNDKDYHCFRNAILAILYKIMYKCKRTYKRLNELNSLKHIENSFFVNFGDDKL